MTGSLGSDHRLPVAVVGLACRMPGAVDPTRFWANLAAGSDSVGIAPASRWRDRDHMPEGLRFGGFLDDVESFDADFFGISAREARYLDPQQRLLLELAWEALEDASILPAALRHRRWGVFVGACADDFRLQYLHSDRLDRFGHTGTSRCMLANRISHHFGLRGPSEVVDTGQSSSLAAVHRALLALRHGECEAALVGGVNLNLLQAVTDQVQLWGGLSPVGRCYTFDARANGYVRGEGGGCVVLKPLAAALRDGDHIYCTVLGSSTGSGSTGLGVPCADAQQAVLTSALSAAGIRPAQVGYVELHGAGTMVGDPVEAAALGSAIGRDRPADNPLLVGSVKTNVGHLEGAAGIAGLLKVCLMFEHGQVPPTLHYVSGNRSINFSELNIAVATRHDNTLFKDAEAAGVSSFGMGGAIVHIVMGPPPLAERPPPVDVAPEPAVWCLSGHTPQAVRQAAAALAGHSFAVAGGADAAAVAWTLTQRTHWQHRAVVVGATAGEFRRGLQKIAAGQSFWLATEAATGWGPLAGEAIRAANAYLDTGDTSAVEAMTAHARRKIPGLPTYRFQRQRILFPPTRRVRVSAQKTPDVSDSSGNGGPSDYPFAEQWRRIPAGPERALFVRRTLERELAVVLGGAVPDYDPSRSFSDQGIDSMSLLEFLDRVIAATSLELPESILFDYPTVEELAEFVSRRMETEPSHG